MFQRILLLTILGWPVVGLAQQGWPMVKFNGQRLNSNGSVHGPQILPDFQALATGVSGSLFAITADGSLALSDGTHISLYSSTGQLEWSTPLFAASVAVGPTGTIYAQTASSVTALNPTTGQVLWAYEVGFGGETTPIAIDKSGVVYLQSGCNCLSGPARVTAINSDGTQKWQYLDSNLNRGYIPIVLNSDETLLFHLSTYNLYGYPHAILLGLSTQDGSVAYQLDANLHPGAFAPWGVLYDETNLVAIANGRVITVGTYGSDGAPLDTYDQFGNLVSSSTQRYRPVSELLVGQVFSYFPMAVADADGTLYLISEVTFPVQEEYVVAVDTASGSELWRYKLPATGEGGLLLGSDGCLYVANAGSLLKGCGEPQVGTINVTTNLSAATFTITGPETYSGSGTSWTVANAPPGDYIIHYDDVPGHLTPSPETKTLPTGGTIDFDGTYTPVTLSVCPVLSPECSQSLSYSYQKGFVGPISPQQVEVSSNGPPLTFTVGTSTENGGNWLFVEPMAGTTPSTLSVSVDPTALPPGVYTGQITTSALGAANSPQVLSVSLTVTTRLPAHSGTLAVTTNESPRASFTIFDASGKPLSDAINVSSFGPSAIRPGPYTVKYNALVGYFTPRTQAFFVGPGDYISLKGVYRRLIVVTFTGFDNSPDTSKCPDPTASTCGIRYWPTELNDESDRGMTVILSEIANIPALTLSNQTHMAAFTFFSSGNGDKLSAPSDNSDHEEAEEWLKRLDVTADDLVVVMGHSYGGNRARLFVEQVKRNIGLTPNLLITLDAVEWLRCNLAGVKDAILDATQRDQWIEEHVAGCAQSTFGTSSGIIPPSSARSVFSFVQGNGAIIEFLGISVHIPIPTGYIVPGSVCQQISNSCPKIPSTEWHGDVDDDPNVHQFIINQLINLVRASN